MKQLDTTNNTEYNIVQLSEESPLDGLITLQEIEELHRIGPQDLIGQDRFVITTITETGEKKRVGIATINPNNNRLKRIGIKEDHRRNGLAQALVDHLISEYGQLTAYCRESLEANKFYQATDWEYKETRVSGEGEDDLLVWVYK